MKGTISSLAQYLGTTVARTAFHGAAKAASSMMAVLALVLGLTGCDAAMDAASRVGAEAVEVYPELAEPNTLIILPGYEVMIDGQATPVYGFDDCYSPHDAMLFGPALSAQGTACIVIAPDAQFVSAMMIIPDGTIAEHWSVERAGAKTLLRRADGKLISAAH